jgi:hypothetical protein
MKIIVSDLGALRQAEFDLGDLSIICGENNSGKTYVTYALFGFLHLWRNLVSVKIESQDIDTLLSNGLVRIPLQPFVQQIDGLLEKCCKAYTKELPKVFAANPDHFRNSRFKLHIDPVNLGPVTHDRKIKSANTELFSLTKNVGEEELIVALLVDDKSVQLPIHAVQEVIARAVAEILFGGSLPRPFIASAERTGAAIFRKELNFARNRLLEEVSQADKSIDPLELLFKDYQEYALPVEQNVKFTRKLETLARKRSFLSREHPELLEDFTDIIGGEYSVTGNDELYFKPKGKRVRLTMDESSSAVRSLLDLGFYLRHEVEPGDLLMMDEPELNLHPESQRRIARLFARLVNLGVKVFLTTHSDYIIKELNTLIMLNRDEPYLKAIAGQEGYGCNELLDSGRVQVYIAESALTHIPGNKKRSRCQTLVAAHIDQELGIEARSFDLTINDMNRIQERIVWEGEEA